MTDNSTTTSVADAAELGREIASAKAIPAEDIRSGLVVRVVRHNERIETVDLEHTLDAPHGCRGLASIYEPTDFAAYVTRLASSSTTLWADPDTSSVTAVFDDHTDGGTPGWRRHRATLSVRRDPEWQAWIRASNQLGTQEWFAEFVEDHLIAIVDPDPATMLEVATTFQGNRHVSFQRGIRLSSGDVQLRWAETTTATAGARGQVEVPERFTIRAAPYLGVEPVQIAARLRYRISDGQLRIGFSLHRPDLAEQEAFGQIRALIAEQTEVPMHLGVAPISLHEKPER